MNWLSITTAGTKAGGRRIPRLCKEPERKGTYGREKDHRRCLPDAYALNPFDRREIPIWISEYVLAGYGTGAIMAVPCGDERDHKFAQHFQYTDYKYYW